MSNVRQATMTWVRDLVFEGGAPDGPRATLDGDGAVAPSPVIALLMAVAACSGSDVVGILEKMRVSLSSFRIEVTGTRREDHPKRFTAIQVTFHLAGTGLDAAKANRAVELSMQKYCSVVQSLAPDIVLTTDIVLG